MVDTEERAGKFHRAAVRRAVHLLLTVAGGDIEGCALRERVFVGHRAGGAFKLGIPGDRRAVRGLDILHLVVGRVEADLPVGKRNRNAGRDAVALRVVVHRLIDAEVIEA